MENLENLIKALNEVLQLGVGPLTPTQLNYISDLVERVQKRLDIAKNAPPTWHDVLRADSPIAWSFKIAEPGQYHLVAGENGFTIHQSGLPFVFGDGKSVIDVQFGADK